VIDGVTDSGLDFGDRRPEDQWATSVDVRAGLILPLAPLCGNLKLAKATMP